MSKTKAAGSAKRTVNVAGKRLGIKKFAGEYVKAGNIIVRQRGTKFHAGTGTKVGRDHTIYATEAGFVTFKGMTGYKRAKKWVVITPDNPAIPVAKPKTKAATKSVEAKKETSTEKKPAAKKTSAKPKAKKASTRKTTKAKAE